jgi:prepilin-type N-terminal cleavage/methylation domain-containing protein
MHVDQSPSVKPPGRGRLGAAISRMRWTADDAGFTLVEVLVSALILVLLSMAVLGALDATTRSSFSDRLHANAEALAQQNENRLRGLNVDELSNLNKTFQGPKLDGVQFTLQETAQYVSDSSGAVSCTNPSADYLEATTTVTWPNMAGRKPVSVTSVLTPTVGSVDSTNGALAVSVLNAAGTGYGGVNVSIAGATNATATTTASGCALFGDLPSGAYTVTVAPPTGTYVDSLTGATISAATPDSRTVSVAAGSVPTSVPFSLDQAGSINFSFTDVWPSGTGSNPAPPVGTTPTAPAVIAFNTNMNAPSYRMCTVQDGSACPVVGSQDQAFPASDWGNGITATPLFPFKSQYSVYAGVCPSDDPFVVSGVQDATATVPAGGPTSVSLALPAMVVRLYSGTTVTSTQEIAMPAGAKLQISDDSCSVDYISGLAAPAAGQATLQLNTSYVPQSTVSDTGLLKYPGMPYGHYTVCYTDASNKIYSRSVTNGSSGVIVNLKAGSTVTGTC